MKKIIAFMLAFPGLVLAESGYTPLLTSTSMDGVKADVGTAAAGIVAVLLIVVGVGFLVRTFR